jgi:hypothetical protein
LCGNAGCLLFFDNAFLGLVVRLLVWGYCWQYWWTCILIIRILCYLEGVIAYGWDWVHLALDCVCWVRFCVGVGFDNYGRIANCEWRLDQMVICGVVLIGLMWREIETLCGAISIDIILGLSWSDYNGVGLLNIVYV